MQPVKKYGGGGEHWLVQMEWQPAGWTLCLPLLISPCTKKSRSSLLALAHSGGRGGRAAKRLWCGGCGKNYQAILQLPTLDTTKNAPHRRQLSTDQDVQWSAATSLG